MKALSAVMQWTYQVLATWYVAALFGGALILLVECLSRRREPSGTDVKRAAERYRQWYGDDALAVLGDHMLGASFAPDNKHKRFLRRVTAELIAGSVTEEDRTRQIEHSAQRLPPCERAD